ncbi:hypothetical protein K449DRAFT_440226 [Hypoxylon sp. EC38]|nr:hypothetical protein K449DRAFT_440226 [Hypoxylon sp. EC38]
MATESHIEGIIDTQAQAPPKAVTRNENEREGIVASSQPQSVDKETTPQESRRFIKLMKVLPGSTVLTAEGGREQKSQKRILQCKWWQGLCSASSVSAWHVLHVYAGGAKTHTFIVRLAVPELLLFPTTVRCNLLR